MLKWWNATHMKCWKTQLLNWWNVTTMQCWNAETLKCWNAWMLTCRNAEIMKWLNNGWNCLELAGIGRIWLEYAEIGLTYWLYLPLFLYIIFQSLALICSALVSRPGRSQGLLYKHLCHSFINWLIQSSFRLNIFTAPFRPIG